MWNDGGGIPKTSLKLVWTDQEQNEEFFIPDVVLMGSPNTPYPLSWKKHQEENNLHKEDISLKQRSRGKPLKKSIANKPPEN